ncbi:MAG: heparinase II/III family protein, partial [Planctomycetes bacterium]|nr:heparinase II/III family protein [Planctomycetota bacterium]
AGYVEQFLREFNNPEVWFYRVHNYNGVNGGAAGCLALTLVDDFPEKSPTWIAESREIVRRWLSGGFDADGAGLEGVGYAGYGLSNSIIFADALKRNGMDSFYDHPLFAKLPEFYALSLLPGEGVCDARNDSSYAGLRLSTLKLAEGTQNGLYRWLWDRAGSERSSLQIAWENDVEPVDPIEAGCPRAKHFRGRGLCIWRTGWDRDDVMFSIEAGPYYPVTHNQADKGHFTLYGLGERWAIDTGYANEHEQQGRGQTLGHSCVLIDGKGQALSGAGLGTSGTIRAFENTAQVGYALVDATEAYNRNNRGNKGAGARRALRHAMFVYPAAGRPAYAVICDDVQNDDQPHDYTWQMMISGAHKATLNGQRAVLAPSASSGNAFVGTAPIGPPEARSEGACVIEVDVVEPGEYALWARVRTPEEDRGSSDSFFIKMDEGKRVAWHMRPSSSWVWDRVAHGVPHEEVSYELSAGRHRLTVLRRERGAEMDCLLLTREKSIPPTLQGASSEPLFAEAENGTVTAPMQVTTTPPLETRLEVHINAESAVTLGTDTFHPKDYHGPAAFPRLRATARAVNPAFMAVLLPLPEDVPAPTVTFASTGGDRRVTVAWESGRDVILWPAAEDRKPVLSREK